MAKPKGRQPNYRLRAMNKVTEQKADVGAGWLNEDGSISIKLNLCVVLTSSADLVITLFPNDREPSRETVAYGSDGSVESQG